MKETELSEISDLLTPYNKRQAHTLHSNVERLVKVVAPSINHVAFFTLTFPDKVYDHREVQRRWNSLRTNYLSKHTEFRHYLGVKEQHKDGAWHLHVVITLAGDVRTGFDFKIFEKWIDDYKKTGKKKRLTTGSIYLRSLWQELRDNLPKYKFGRSELVPIKSNAKALSYYVGKYVSKHISQRTPQAKGARLIFSSQGWAKNSIRFGWLTQNAKQWRLKLQRFAQLHGCDEIYQLTEKLGSNWAFRHCMDIYNVFADCDLWMRCTVQEYVPETIKNIRRNQGKREAYLKENLKMHTRTASYKKEVVKSRAWIAEVTQTEKIDRWLSYQFWFPPSLEEITAKVAESIQQFHYEKISQHEDVMWVKQKYNL